MTKEPKHNQTIAARIAKFESLGLVRTRPGHEVVSMFFAVSVYEFKVAEEGFFALMEKYQVSGQDMLLIREAVAYMYYHTLGQVQGEVELSGAARAAKVRWQ